MMRGLIGIVSTVLLGILIFDVGAFARAGVKGFRKAYTHLVVVARSALASIGAAINPTARHESKRILTKIPRAGHGVPLAAKKSAVQRYERFTALGGILGGRAPLCLFAGPHGPPAPGHLGPGRLPEGPPRSTWRFSVVVRSPPRGEDRTERASRR